MIEEKKNKKNKKNKKKFVKQNGYNNELPDTYMREVLDEDKKFDDEFDID